MHYFNWSLPNNSGPCVQLKTEHREIRIIWGRGHILFNNIPQLKLVFKWWTEDTDESPDPDPEVPERRDRLPARDKSRLNLFPVSGEEPKNVAFLRVRFFSPMGASSSEFFAWHRYAVESKKVFEKKNFNLLFFHLDLFWIEKMSRCQGLKKLECLLQNLFKLISIWMISKAGFTLHGHWAP